MGIDNVSGSSGSQLYTAISVSPSAELLRAPRKTLVMATVPNSSIGPLGTTHVADGLICRDRVGSNGTDWDGEWENKNHCTVRELPSRPAKNLVEPRDGPRSRPPSYFIPFDPTLSRQIKPIWYRHINATRVRKATFAFTLKTGGAAGPLPPPPLFIRYLQRLAQSEDR